MKKYFLSLLSLSGSVADSVAQSCPAVSLTANIPTHRAGATDVTLNGKIGLTESETVQLPAHNETEIPGPETEKMDNQAPVAPGEA